MEKKMFAFTSLLAGFFCFVIFSSFNEGDEPEIALSAASPESSMQHVTGFDLQKPYHFAGELVPMQNFDARERLDRELSINTYLQSMTSLNIKTANRYFPVIEPILKANGVPDDFKYLCVAESNLRMATSPAGAKGLWQFIASAAKENGLEVTAEVDERYNVEKSTEAACQFLKRLKNRFGSWTLAAAAYNMGPTMLVRRLEEQQVDTYYDLNLSEETSRYVFRIIAIKEIMSDPEHYGFFIAKEHLYPAMPDYYTVPIDGSISNLSDFAKQHGTNFRMLRLYNPWLIGNSLTNKAAKRYEVRIPRT